MPTAFCRFTHPTQPTHPTQLTQPMQPTQPAQLTHPTEPMLPATATLPAVAMLPATATLPAVAVLPATAAASEPAVRSRSARFTRDTLDQQPASALVDHGDGPPLSLPRMCRNIRTLHNFEPPATEEEIRAAALQYVRKVSGATKPSAANAEAFNRAVDEVAVATAKLLDELVTRAPPKDRGLEAARRRERAAKRFAA